MISPALDTPPPKINASGLVTIPKLARLKPKFLPNTSMTFKAISSFFFAASNITFADRYFSFLKEEGVLVSLRYFFARLTTPVAEVTVSKQPILPQLHWKN